MQLVPDYSYEESQVHRYPMVLSEDQQITDAQDRLQRFWWTRLQKQQVDRSEREVE